MCAGHRKGGKAKHLIGAQMNWAKRENLDLAEGEPTSASFWSPVKTRGTTV